MGSNEARSRTLMKIKSARWELRLIALIKPESRHSSRNSCESCVDIERLVKIIDGSATVDVSVNMLQPYGSKAPTPFYYPEKRRKLYEHKRCSMYGLMRDDGSSEYAVHKPINFKQCFVKNWTINFSAQLMVTVNLDMGQQRTIWLWH